VDRRPSGHSAVLMVGRQGGNTLSVPVSGRFEAIPKMPVLSMGSLAIHKRAWSVPSVLDAERVEWFRSGRVALDAALRLVGASSGGEVLLPAYHCVSMVEPVLRSGARPVFYRVRPTTAVDLEHFKSRISSASIAAIVPHYFGFPQAMDEIRAICTVAGIVLIEDCAHALFGAYAEKPLGSFGDYAIASPWKFLPVATGGCLVSSQRCGPVAQPDAVGLAEDLRTVLNSVESSRAYRRLRFAGAPLVPAIALSNWRSRKARVAAASIEGDPRVANVAGDQALPGLSRIARYVARHIDRDRVSERRRAAYRMLLASWSDLNLARPLHPELGESVVPQVFPLVMGDPDRAFGRLKQAGVPIIRFGEFLWEGMPADTCEVSNDLSRRVFQFPCHQELSDDELTWLADTVKRVVEGQRRPG
jgi:perosamine synthetase